MFTPILFKSRYLGNEEEAERDGGAEDDEEADDEVGCILFVLDEEGDRDSGHAHDDDVVHTHPDILRIVQGRDRHVTRLPRQKTAKYLNTVSINKLNLYIST